MAAERLVFFAQTHLYQISAFSQDGSPLKPHRFSLMQYLVAQLIKGLLISLYNRYPL